MTTSLKKMKTGLGSEPVFKIEVEYCEIDDKLDCAVNYRDVYNNVTNISINNGNIFFIYKTKTKFNNSIFDQSVIIGEGTLDGSDLHTNIELQEIDNINIENMGY